MRLHREPAEGQTPVIGVFLEFLEYLIGLRVVPRAARDQVYLSAVCWIKYGIGAQDNRVTGCGAK